MYGSTNRIGAIIRDYRKRRSESITDLAQAIGVERAYLNKIELGTVEPSMKLLDKLLAHFSVDENEAQRLRQLVKHQPVTSPEDGKEKDMANAPQSVAPAQPQQQISLNPMQTPVLYTDSVFVSSNDYGLVLDVAQTINGQQHTIVSRIGMSFDHAKKLLEVMQDHLAKNER